MDEKIKFKDELTGEEIEFFVLEQTKINNMDYLLVTASDDGEEEAYILKDLSLDDEEEAVYEFVEDVDELEYVSKIFEEILEDIEFKQDEPAGGFTCHE